MNDVQKKAINAIKGAFLPLKGDDFQAVKRYITDALRTGWWVYVPEDPRPVSVPQETTTCTVDLSYLHQLEVELSRQRAEINRLITQTKSLDACDDVRIADILKLRDRVDKLESKPEVKPAGIQVGDTLEYLDGYTLGWRPYFTITSLGEVDIAQKRCLGGDRCYRVIRRTATGFDVVAGNKTQQ